MKLRSFILQNLLRSCFFSVPLLLQESSLTPRKAPPCDVEIMALVQLSAVPVLVRLQDGNKVEVMADSWTSVTDLEKQVCSTTPS